MAISDGELEVLKDYLKEKHTTLWLNWDISNDEGRTLAAKWIAETIEDIMDFAEHYND